MIQSKKYYMISRNYWVLVKKFRLNQNQRIKNAPSGQDTAEKKLKDPKYQNSLNRNNLLIRVVHLVCQISKRKDLRLIRLVL